MNNVIIGIDNSNSYRVHLAITTELVEEARKCHDTTPLATAGLGRVLTGAGLMAVQLKDEKNVLTLQFKGDGPAKQILATANGRGEVKGFISNPDVDMPLKPNGKLDVGGSLGIGELTVIKDLGLKEPYNGTIALVSGEIADDLTAYYFISEQQNTSIALGVKVDRDYSVLAAGGMFIQMLPNACEEAIFELEKMLDKMPPLTTLIEEVTNENMGLTEEGLLQRLMEHIFRDIKEEYMPKKFGESKIMWQCDCDRNRIKNVLKSIGRKELKAIIEEDGQAELTCRFCETEYNFDKNELETILSEI